MMQILRFFVVFAILNSLALRSAKALDVIDAHSQSAASLGVAGAYSLVADDSSAFFLNPAGLARSTGHRKIWLDNHFLNSSDDFSLTTSVIDGKSQDPLSVGFLFNLVRLDIDEGSLPEIPEYRRQDYQVSLAYNYEDFILVGMTQQLTNFDRGVLTPEELMFAIHGGVLVYVHDFVAVGARANNIYRSFKDELLSPILLAGGVSLNLESIRLNIEYERNQTRKLHIGRVGLEYLADDWMIMRGGFAQDKDGDERIYSLGFTLKPSRSFFVESGFLDQLKGNLRILSVGIGFNL